MVSDISYKILMCPLFGVSGYFLCGSQTYSTVFACLHRGGLLPPGEALSVPSQGATVFN